VRNLIRQILKENTKVVNKIKKLINGLFPGTLIHTDYFVDNYDDEDVEYDIRITYRLSEKTQIVEDIYGGVKPYQGLIYLDILKIESTTYENPGEYKTFYYEDDLPDQVWVTFEELLYEKIQPILPFLYFYIKFDINTKR